jgi:TM2 domain-containing membrane protein YozV
MSDPQQPYSAPLPPPAGYGAPPSAPHSAPYSPYLQPAPAPYGWSDKSKTAAGLLQLLLSLVGVPGVGRLYAGHLGIGLGQLLGMFVGYVLLIFLVGFIIVPAMWIWGVVDGLVMLVGDPKDGQGRPLRP